MFVSDFFVEKIYKNRKKHHAKAVSINQGFTVMSLRLSTITYTTKHVDI